MALEPFETAHAQGFPAVRQFSVFIEDRVGQLLRLTKLFEDTDIRILALSVINAVDCAVARMVVDDPTGGAKILSDAGFAYSDTDVIVVSIPLGKRGLLDLWSALLGAEINISYTYALLPHPKHHPAMVVKADEPDMAAEVLRARNLTVLDQGDLIHPI